MAEEQQSLYGYADDTPVVNPFVFGLNAGNTFLTKFEYTPTGGKDGAEQDALDIEFDINGTSKSYRLFPVTKAFLRNNKGETTDPNAAEFKEAALNLNKTVTHILHCFVPTEAIKAAMSRPMPNGFKDFAKIAVSILPKDFSKKALDIFLDYQWQMSPDKDRTYLQIPTKIKYGSFVCAAKPGTWTKVVVENAPDEVPIALKYVNEKGEVHPFTRSGYYMNNNYAKQQRTEVSSGATAMNSSYQPIAVPEAAVNGAEKGEVAETLPPPESW